MSAPNNSASFDLGELTASLGPQVAPFIAHALRNWKPYKPSWNYEDGCIYKGALDLFASTGEKSFFDFVCREVSARVAADGTIRLYDPKEFNIDNVNGGKVFFELFQATGEDRFRGAIEKQAAQLAQHPRTRSGNYWHKSIYPHQVWLDGLYMAQPFQLAFSRFANKAELAHDTANQFAHVREAMRDIRSGLYFHGWDESRAHRWANPQTGCSPNFWARAMGWFVMAMADCLELDETMNSRDRAVLAEMLQGATEALLRVRSKSGMWFQVLNQGDRARNYEECSATLMIAYALMKGRRLKVLGEGARDAGQLALKAVIDRYLTPTSLGGICGVAGLGGSPYRDGSYDYYVSEPIVANDPKGVGALFMSVSEALR